MYITPSAKRILNTFYNEVLPEIANGNLYVGKMPIAINFNIGINDEGKIEYVEGKKNDELPTMIIEDKGAFDYHLVKLIEEIYDTAIPLRWKESPSYIKSETIFSKEEKNHLKYYLSTIWSNMTYMDLINPVSYLQRYLSFLNDNTFKYKKIVSDKIDRFDGCYMRLTNIEKGPTSETPYAFKIEILDRLPINVLDEKKCQKYILPNVMYGIEETLSGKRAYIYAIHEDKEDKKTNNMNPLFASKINRLLHQVNKDVSKEEVSKARQTQTDEPGFEENIVDITVSAITALTFVLALFNQNDINNIIIPTSFPVRWESIRMINMEELDYQKEKYNYNEKELADLEELYDQKQYKDNRNITDKMIRNFRRLAFHFNGVKIISYPFDFDMDDFMYVSLDEQLIPNNEDHLLAQIAGSINYKTDGKTK